MKTAQIFPIMNNEDRTRKDDSINKQRKKIFLRKSEKRKLQLSFLKGNPDGVTKLELHV